MKELVESQFGKDKWTAICEKASFPTNTIITLGADIDDPVVMKLIDSTCSTLNLSIEQVADAFGDYWVNTYAFSIYKSIFSKFKNAREFILGMDDVHIMVTKTVPNAKPPRFTYNFIDDKTLVMNYNSSRGLILILVGLVKGLGKHFNEKLTVTKINETSIRIVFN
jgi:hypothetical protein